MPFESLKDGLSEENDKITIEHYPRPKRAIIIAQRTSARIALD